MLSLLGYRLFNHPEICSGDQSRMSLLATIIRSFLRRARRHGVGRRADSQARRSASPARYSGRPLGRATSRLTVDAARCKPRAISRIEEPEAIPREMSSRSASVSVRTERRRTAGTIPPAATTGTESSHGSCQWHDQSHATTLQPSNGARRQSAAP